MQKLVDTLAGELQKAVEHEENFPLNDHDVVAPLIIQGTDIAAAADRWALPLVFTSRSKTEEAWEEEGQMGARWNNLHITMIQKTKPYSSV